MAQLFVAYQTGGSVGNFVFNNTSKPKNDTEVYDLQKKLAGHTRNPAVVITNFIELP